MAPKKTPAYVVKAEQLLFFLLLSFPVLALPLSITIDERFGLNQTYFAYPAPNVSGTATGGYGVITITNSAGERISDISVFLNQTDSFNNTPVLQSGTTGYASGSPGSMILLHIPSLESGSNSVWNYTINSTGSSTLNITITHFPTRVLLGTMFNVTMNVSSTVSSARVDFNVTQNAIGGFQFQGVRNYTDGSVPTDTASQIVWTNVQILPGESDRLIYRVLAPTVSQTTYYTFSDSFFAYTMNTTSTGVVVYNVTAGGQILVQSKKERFANNIWNVTPYAQNIATNLTYNLTTFSTWSTVSPVEPGGSLDPGAAKMTNSTYTWNASVIIAPGQSWTNDSISFVNTSVPLVWVRASYRIVSQNISQVITSSNATYVYTQRMYVIKGYAIRITKLLKSLSTPNTYNITINISNVGDDNSTEPVYIADIVPANFSLNASKITINSYTWNGTMLNITSDKQTPSSILYSMYGALNFTGNQSITSGEFANMLVYYWALKAVRTNETIIINYELAGSGDYRFFDAVVIGVDPARVFGHGVGSPIFSASEMIAVRSPEVLLIIATALFAVVIAVKLRRQGENSF